MFFACTESQGDLQRLGTELGIRVSEAVDAGALTIELLGHLDESLDEMGHKLLRMVDEQKVRRLVVDGLAGLGDTLAFPERGNRFLGRLLRELKKRGVTSMFTVDPHALAAATGTPFAHGVIGWFDNAMALASDLDGSRSLTIKKVRGSRAGKTSVDVHLQSPHSGGREGR